MENGPFIDDFPIKTSIYQGFSMAMLKNQMVDVAGTSRHSHGHATPCYAMLARNKLRQAQEKLESKQKQLREANAAPHQHKGIPKNGAKISQN